MEDFAGICVKSKNGRIDHIFSLSDAAQTATYQGMKVKADYAVISNEYAGNRAAIAFPCLQAKLRLKDASQLHKKPGDLMEPQASMDRLPVLRPGSLRQHILAEIVIIAAVQVPETAA